MISEILAQLTRDIVTGMPLVLSIGVRTSTLSHTTCPLLFGVYLMSAVAGRSLWSFPLGFLTREDVEAILYTTCCPLTNLQDIY